MCSRRGPRVSEIGRIKIDAGLPRFGPIDPTLEMVGLQTVALDFPAARLGITRMEI